MQFTWTSFGIMASPRVDNRYIYAANEQGDIRKMSKIKYPEFSVVAQKCAFLVGYPTIIRTSQNSSTWAINEWFSDITLEDHTSHVWLSGKNNSRVETLEELKWRLDTFSTEEQKGGAASEEMTILQEEYDALPCKSRDKIQRDTEKFLQMNDWIGSSRHLNMRGNHPFQTLALRAGIDASGKSKLHVKITGHAYLNNYHVDFVDFDEKGLIGIGVDERDGNDFYLATCLSVDRNWRRQEPKVTGLGGKNRTDVKIAQFLEWHKEIKTYLYMSASKGG